MLIKTNFQHYKVQELKKKINKAIDKSNKNQKEDKFVLKLMHKANYLSKQG